MARVTVCQPMKKLELKVHFLFLGSFSACCVLVNVEFVALGAFVALVTDAYVILARFSTGSD